MCYRFQEKNNLHNTPSKNTPISEVRPQITSILDCFYKLISPFCISLPSYSLVSVKESGKSIENFRNTKLRHIKKG